MNHAHTFMSKNKSTHLNLHCKHRFSQSPLFTSPSSPPFQLYKNVVAKITQQYSKLYLIMNIELNIESVKNQQYQKRMNTTRGFWWWRDSVGSTSSYSAGSQLASGCEAFHRSSEMKDSRFLQMYYKNSGQVHVLEAVIFSPVHCFLLNAFPVLVIWDWI